MSGFGVEAKEKNAPLCIHIFEVALVGGAEVVNAGIDGEADVGLSVGGADPGAVKADIDLLCAGAYARHVFDEVDERFAGWGLCWV
jgi:hypothetical protein